MGRVILCTGQTAKTPYHFEEPDVNVWNVEELCYVLTQNAFLLDRGLVSKKLVEWIEKECGLPQLGRLLYPYLNKKDSTENFVSEILKYVGLYDEETIMQTENIMKMGESLSVYEKRKKRIDFLVEKEKYETALSEYDRLLSELPPGERNLSAQIWHNRGVALAGLFSFAHAAESFERAYELSPDEETWLQFLAAKRMELSDTEYITFAAQSEEKYPLVLQLEQKMEELLSEYAEEESKQYLEQLKEWRYGEEAGQYYAETEKMVQKLKEVYRSHAIE